MHRLSPSSLFLLVLLLSGSLLPISPAASAPAPHRLQLAATGPVLPGPALIACDSADDMGEVLPASSVDLPQPAVLLLPASFRPQPQPLGPQQQAFFHLSRPPPQQG